MANTLSAKKRIRQNKKRHARNQAVRTRAKTYIRRARQAIRDGEIEQAEELVRSASSALDRAASKGVIHKNNAARRKSRLMRRLRKAQGAA